MSTETFLLLPMSILAITLFATFQVGLLRHWIKLNAIVDVPNGRSSHTQPTPRGGGLVIVTIVLFGWLLYMLVSDVTAFYYVRLAFFWGLALVAAISWLDDVRTLSGALRILVHLGAAALVVTALALSGLLQFFVPLAHLPLSLTIGLSLLWIVGLTNAYNFMDGIDGIAGSQAVVTGAVWSLLGFVTGQTLLLVPGLPIGASALGFLYYNWQPARIFMGDVGSAFWVLPGPCWRSLPLNMTPGWRWWAFSACGPLSLTPALPCSCGPGAARISSMLIARICTSVWSLRALATAL
ncbi:MAG: hypothetical protein R2911_27505 [Caldilineaceae bacterium]